MSALGGTLRGTGEGNWMDGEGKTRALVGVVIVVVAAVVGGRLTDWLPDYYYWIGEEGCGRCNRYKSEQRLRLTDSLSD